MRWVPSRRLVLPLVPVVVALFPSFASGQCQHKDCFDAYLVATYDGSAMQIQISLAHRTFSNICRGNKVGFDLYRTAAGYYCGPEERVTDEPIPWVAECDAPVELSFTDPDVSGDTVYRYEARPVDADRNPASGEWDFPIVGYGIVGTAVVAHGRPYLGDNFHTFVRTCVGECMPGGVMSVSGFPWWEYWENGTVTVWADGASIMYYSNGWVTIFHGTAAVASRCLVGVETVGWSAVKRLYD